MHHRSVRFTVVVVSISALVGLSSALAGAGSAGASALTSGPLIRASGNQSVNWSGYAEPGSFTSIGGSWTVPTAGTSAATTTYASTWIGVDGLANRDLIQTGTESDVIGGVVHYDAWWEVLPAAERVIKHMTVQPGDRMAASIVRGPAATWTISLTDATTGSTFSLTRHYRGPGASAEWIQERPQVGRSLATLSAYGTTAFTGLAANGSAPGLVPADALSMVTAVGGPVISTPSALSRSGTSFAVSYGAAAPPAPAG